MLKKSVTVSGKINFQILLSEVRGKVRIFREDVPESEKVKKFHKIFEDIKVLFGESLK